MSDLTISEIAEKKEELQENILNLIDTFEKETKITVNSITLSSLQENKIVYVNLFLGI